MLRPLRVVIAAAVSLCGVALVCPPAWASTTTPHYAAHSNDLHASNVIPAPDYTGSLYPSGCRTYSYGPSVPGDENGNARNDFKPNCYLGSGYITNAVFIAGVQVINGDFGYNNGGQDGVWGPNTLTGVKDWQSGHGISADGIVGPSTWFDYGDVLYYSYAGSNFWSYSVAQDPNRFFKGNYKDSSGHFGPWSLNCGEVSLLFSDGNYPNPKVACV